MSLARVHFQCMHFVRILASNVMVVAGGLCFIMLHFMHIMHNRDVQRACVHTHSLLAMRA